MTNGVYSSGGIQVNPRQLMIQQQNAHDPFSTNTSFDKFLSLAGTASSMAMPVAGAAFQKFGGANSMGAAITSTMLSGFAGQGGVSTPGFNAVSANGGANYGVGKSLSLPGAPPGFPGGGGGAGGLGAPPGFPGAGGGGFNPGNLSGSQDVSQFDSQIDSMMNNNLMFLAVQTKVQNVSQTTQLMSNIYKADSDAKLNAVRNVRA